MNKYRTPIKNFRHTINYLFFLFLPIFLIHQKTLAECNFTLEQDWAGGFTAKISITNDLPETINGWEISWAFEGPNKLTNLWNAKVSGNNPYTMTPESWNAQLQPGETLEFDLQGNKESPNDLVIPRLSGNICNKVDTLLTPARWILESDSSQLEFVTLKKVNTAEIQSFSQLEGSLDEAGNGVFKISLDSIETNIETRNTRMRDFLFETDLLPDLFFTANINDLDRVEALSTGQTLRISLEGMLALHGIKQAIATEVLVVKNNANSFSVSNTSPILLDAKNFDMNSGIEILRTVANLSSITEMVPTYFHLVFSQNTDPSLAALEPGTSPAIPDDPVAEIDSDTGDIEVTWNDEATNESGYIVRVKDPDGVWGESIIYSRDTEFHADRLTMIGEYIIRVIAVDGSTPSIPLDIPVIIGEQIISCGAQGETLYQTQCANCHGANRKGGITGVSLDSPLSINIPFVIETRMPLGNAGACDGDCAQKIAEFLACNYTTEEIPGPRHLSLLTRYEYTNTVQDLLGISEPAIANNFPNEAKVNGYDNNAAFNVVTDRHVTEYLAAAQALATTAINSNRNTLIPCNDETSACATDFIHSFGEKAFRRPLSTEERDNYLSLFEQESAFDDGIALIIQGMLVSPYFLYKSAMGEYLEDSDNGKIYQLSQYEIAASLSYMFWGTLPDEILLNAANNNLLTTKQQLKSQAIRLLNDERARRHLGHFVEQWLQAGRDSIGVKDETVYPDFTREIAEAMNTEMKTFFNHVVFDSSQKITELYTADYTFANDKLAQYYDLTGANNATFRKVKDASGHRGGLLTLGAVMSAFGHANETAPIPRGKFVRRRIMCQDFPDPPVELDTSFPDPDPALTTRERFEFRTSADDCQDCHKYLNGVGFGFEAFDGAGAFRTEDNGKLVNVFGDILGLNIRSNDDSNPYQGAREMQMILAEAESVKQCLPRQFFRFARGYAEDGSDNGTLTNIYQSFENSQYNIFQMMVSLTQLDSFPLRREQ